MSENGLPYISVIITAHNRKDFLLNAIKSVIEQTLDKKYYEVIVIKNFTDNITDSYIQNHKITGIITDQESLSGKLITALNVARGTVISFLEDDDLFTEHKLEVIYKKFTDNHNPCYYYNANISINGETQKSDSKLRKIPVLTMSSISVKKSILNVGNLKKINLGHDHFMYLSALESGVKIIKGKEILTYYMVHDSWSQFYTDDINEFIKHKTLLLESGKCSFLMLDKMFNSVKAKNYITQQIAYLEIVNYIFGDYKKPENAFGILKKSTMPCYIRLELYLAYLMVRIHYNLRYIIIKKMFTNNIKKFY